MKAKPNCVVMTRDKVLSKKIAGYLGLRVNLSFIAPEECTHIPACVGKTAIMLLDLRLWQSVPSLREEIHPSNIDFIIGMGNKRSDPAIEAARFGISQIIPLDLERLELQSVALQAHKHLLTKLELTALQEGCKEHLPVKDAKDESEIFSRLTQAMQNLGNTGAIYKQSVEATSCAIGTPRVTLYLINQEGTAYVCRAFLSSQGEITHSNIPANSQIVHILQTKGHLLSRQYLNELGEAEAMLALSEFLESTGTDVLAPLFGSGSFLGWIAVGRKATGRPLKEGEFSRLTTLSATLGPLLENAMEIERNNLQMKLLESLFQAIPVGIIAVGFKGNVQWLNAAAETLLSIRFQTVLGVPLARVCAPLAEISQSILENHKEDTTQLCLLGEGLPVEVRVVRQSSSATTSGLLFLLEDVSEREHLRLEQEKSRRSELLADISVDVSSRIRSPLTTIKTFSQLLPELLEDTDFRNQFSEVMTNEINRLDELATNIATIGKLTQLRSEKPAVVFSLEESIKTAMCLSGGIWERVELKIAPNLPSFKGNPERLGEALFHLVANADDSIPNAEKGRIVLSAQRAFLGRKMEVVEISVLDNRPVKKVGEFIDHSNLGSRENINRADLRLSIATRIVHEAAGSIHLKTYDGGVCIKLILPINGDNS